MGSTFETNGHDIGSNPVKALHAPGPVPVAGVKVGTART